MRIAGEIAADALRRDLLQRVNDLLVGELVRVLHGCEGYRKFQRGASSSGLALDLCRA